MASIKMKWMSNRPIAVEIGSVLKFERVKPFLYLTLTSMIYGELLEAWLDLNQNMSAYLDIKHEIKGVLKKSDVKAVIK